MDKKEEFKKFINNHPELTKYIKNKEMTMQSFYELYDVYGSDSNIWDKYFKNESRISDIGSLLKNINIDNIEHHVNNAEKILGIIEELASTTPEIKTTSSIPVTKFFGD